MRNPADTEITEIKLRSKDGVRKSFLVMEDSHSDHGWQRTVEQSPLGQRGWVLQERLLASRNIFFCSKKVFFECYEQRWNESRGTDITSSNGLRVAQELSRNRSSQSHPSRAPESKAIRRLEQSTSSTKASSVTLSPTIKSLLPLTSSREHNYRIWSALVEIYSATEVTKPHDRLAAVAGIAQRFHTALRDDVCLAGLWHSHLALHMLWASNQAASAHRNSLHQPQMTFSWCAVGDPVHMRYMDLDQQYILPNVKSVKWRANETAAAQEEPCLENVFILPPAPCVEIRVEGALKRLKLTKGWLSQAWVVPVGLEDLHGISSSTARFKPVLAELDFTLNEPELEISKLNDSNRLFYIPWCSFRDRQRCYALLVQSVEDEKDGSMGRFRRVGLMSHDCTCGSIYLASQTDEAQLPCWRYDPVKRTHVIYII